MMLQGDLTVLCYALVPVLTALAYRRWHAVTRFELDSWRNSIGLAAMVIAIMTWMFWVTLFILGFYRIGLPGTLGQL